MNVVATTAQCEWCGREIVARNRNGVEKRYCGGLCKGAFQTAAVRCARLLLREGRISIADLKATLIRDADTVGRTSTAS